MKIAVHYALLSLTKSKEDMINNHDNLMKEIEKTNIYANSTKISNELEIKCPENDDSDGFYYSSDSSDETYKNYNKEILPFIFNLRKYPLERDDIDRIITSQFFTEDDGVNRRLSGFETHYDSPYNVMCDKYSGKINIKDSIKPFYDNENYLEMHEIDLTDVIEFLFDIKKKDYIKKNKRPSYILKDIGTSERKPLQTILNMHSALVDINYEGCSNGCCGKPSSDVDIFVSYGYSFDVKQGEYCMNFENVRFYEDESIEGIIKINIPSKSFNHAACNSVYSNTLKYEGFEEEILLIDYNIEFEITKDEIILNICPYVVV